MSPSTVPVPDARLADQAGSGHASFQADVHVLLTRGDRVLMLRRAADAAYAAGLLTLPSGRVEAGERLRAAAVREVREETGVELSESMLRFVHVVQHRGPGQPVRFGFFFHASGWPGARRPDRHGEPFNAEPGKHSELLWVCRDDLPADTVAYTFDALTAIRDGHLAAEHFQQPGDAVAHTPGAPSVLEALPMNDTAGEPLRRALGFNAPPRIGRPWAWHVSETVPQDLPVRQVLGWLFAPDGRVLVVQDTDGTVTLPGGGVEAGDADAWAALVREADEEASASVAEGVYLGFLRDPDGVIYGHAPCARARYAGRLADVAQVRPDPATGTVWRRWLVPPRMAAALFGWDEGLAEALAAQHAAARRWGLPRNESWEAEELPAEGRDFTGSDRADFSDRAARVERMPQVGACAGVLFRDAVGRVLLVESTYREDGALLLPGGSVEADGESPREAAEREVAEELGVRLPIGRMLAVDWSAAADRPPLQVTVFDGGVLDAAQIARLAPGDGGEVARLVWADPRLAGLRMRAAAARRIGGAVNEEHTSRQVTRE